MDPDIQQLLDEGIASLRIGNKEEARRKLMQIINKRCARPDRVVQNPINYRRRIGLLRSNTNRRN